LKKLVVKKCYIKQADKVVYIARFYIDGKKKWSESFKDVSQGFEKVKLHSLSLIARYFDIQGVSVELKEEL